MSGPSTKRHLHSLIIPWQEFCPFEFAYQIYEDGDRARLAVVRASDDRSLRPVDREDLPCARNRRNPCDPRAIGERLDNLSDILAAMKVKSR
ncbi:MAG: hypothetical protein K6V73_12160 [Firmicutes bacterium]|nr:hypothetical protein [Bacillota bacterium]